MRVVEPRRDWDGVVRVEYVGRGRVVEDDRVGDGAAQLREVLQKVRDRSDRVSGMISRWKMEEIAYLDVVPAVVVAALAEQSVGDGLCGIKSVEDGVGVLSTYP